MPKVKFRIVGTYFGSKDGVTGEIEVDVPEATPTVYDVMKAVVIKVRNGDVRGVDSFDFDPLFPSITDDLTSVRIRYTQPPKLNSEQPLAGIYVLQDRKDANPLQIFQYYIVDSEGRQKNRNNRSAPFNAPPDSPIIDGDAVIWRQVSIMSGPNGSRFVETRIAQSAKTIRALK